jgi:hypothetical protein
MSNVVTSFTRKLTSRNQPAVDPRHRRDGFFDEADTWHDAESESGAMAEDRVAR